MTSNELINAEAERPLRVRTDREGDDQEWIDQMEMHRVKLVRVVAGNAKKDDAARLRFLRAVNDGYASMLVELQSRGQL